MECAEAFLNYNIARQIVQRVEATFGRLHNDGVEPVWALPDATMPSSTETETGLTHLTGQIMSRHMRIRTHVYIWIVSHLIRFCQGLQAVV